VSICVVGGLGYVGLVTSACLAELGHAVTVVDVDSERLALVREGQMPFHEPGLREMVERGLASGRLRLASALGEGMKDARIVFVAVATPARPDGETDLSQVISAAEELARLLQGRTIIAIKSTVPLGSHQAVKRVLDAYGRVAGRDYDLVAVPEFLREGNAVHDFMHPTRIVIGGADPDVRREIRQLFVRLDAPVLETTFEQALLIKYASNAFLAVRVSFANELAGLCDAAGVDVAQVIRGMGYDARIWHAYLAPGIGFGGPCLEKDLRSLIRVAESAGYEPAFLRAVLEKNDHQIRQVVRRANEALDSDLYHRSIAILGLAFKPGTSDVRNSLAVRILSRLQRQGAAIRAHDPLANAEARQLFEGLPVFDDPYEAAKDSHLILVLNGCEEFRRLDLERLRALVAVPNLIDGVNVIDPGAARLAGFTYQGVGRR
jgi:UDPglucose 6-dehydrogenase